MVFFLAATVAMITEKLPFSYINGNHCQGNKFLHENYAAYQSKLNLKKWGQIDAEFSRRDVIKLYLCPIVMTHYIFGFLLSFAIYLSGFQLLYEIVYFYQIPLIGSLNMNSLCSDTHSFLKIYTKKNQERSTYENFLQPIKDFQECVTTAH